MGRPADLPTLFLRFEGLVLLALAVVLYALAGYGWLLFVLVLLLPDVSMVGYAGGPRLGAYLYNAAHTYLGPATLAVVGIVAEAPGPIAVALIWFAHIGMDRLLGYGLKRTTGFRDTHLGRIGRD
jgi:hypothetical protein